MRSPAANLIPDNHFKDTLLLIEATLHKIRAFMRRTEIHRESIQRRLIEYIYFSHRLAK
jgi:hypothetical protein